MPVIPRKKEIFLIGKSPSNVLTQVIETTVVSTILIISASDSSMPRKFEHIILTRWVFKAFYFKLMYLIACKRRMYVRL